MIRNKDLFNAWENQWLQQQNLSLKEKLQILDSMYQEARTLGVFPLKDPLEGIEFKIKLAKDLHVRRAA